MEKREKRDEVGEKVLVVVVEAEEFGWQPSMSAAERQAKDAGRQSELGAQRAQDDCLPEAVSYTEPHDGEVQERHLEEDIRSRSCYFLFRYADSGGKFIRRMGYSKVERKRLLFWATA